MNVVTCPPLNMGGNIWSWSCPKVDFDKNVQAFDKPPTVYVLGPESDFWKAEPVTTSSFQLVLTQGHSVVNRVPAALNLKWIAVGPVANAVEVKSQP